MVGPTGSGKTEIARRLSKISEAPFIKVEATKFTEVGYHGSDVDQIIKDLVQTAVHACSRDLPSIEQEFKPLIEDLVTEQLLNAFLGSTFSNESVKNERREWIKEGKYDARGITVEIPESIKEQHRFSSLQEAVDFLKGVRFYPAKEEDAQAEVMQVKKAREHIYEWYMDIL